MRPVTSAECRVRQKPEPPAPNLAEWRAALDALPAGGSKPWTSAENQLIIEYYGRKEKGGLEAFFKQTFGRNRIGLSRQAEKLRNAGHPVARYAPARHSQESLP